MLYPLSYAGRLSVRVTLPPIHQTELQPQTVCQQGAKFTVLLNSLLREPQVEGRRAAPFPLIR